MLGELEARVLYAVVHCEGDAYGITVHDAILECTGQNVGWGGLYATLDRCTN